MQAEDRQRLETGLLDLLRLVADRLTPDQREFARDLIEAHGEYGVALEMIADWLIEYDSPITPIEWTLARDSAVAMAIEDGTMARRLKALRVTDAG